MAKRRDQDDLKPRSKRVRFANAKTQPNDPLIYRDDFGFDHPQDFDEEVERQLEKRKLKLRQTDADSDDEEDAEPSTSALNDEDDMFADEKPAMKKPVGGSLDPSELEGQEEGPENEFTSVRNVQDEGEESGGEKQIPITPFNLRDEMEEGKFTEDGMYLAAVDEDRIHDNWLEGFKAADIKKAAQAHQKREELQRKAEEERAFRLPNDRNQLLRMLYDHMKPGETVVRTLKRIGSGTTLQPRRNKNKESGQKMDVSAGEESKKQIEKVTEIADALMAQGYFHVYEDTYETIQEKLVNEGVLEVKSESIKDGDQWEYKWEAEGEAFGPFSTQDMRAWYEQGYFQNPILLRKQGKETDFEHSVGHPLFQ